tara:strand:- start:1026 stop:1244 length:219 start_codon:yes stop_codon:yes gene_type:complete
LVGVAELADATDLKSVSRLRVPVRFRPPTPFYEPLAQQVEQRTFNPFVVGSIPTWLTMNLATLAQMDRATDL